MAAQVGIHFRNVSRRASIRSSANGVLLSRSARTICWLCATMRVLTEVGRPLEIVAGDRYVTPPDSGKPASAPFPLFGASVELMLGGRDCDVVTSDSLVPRRFSSQQKGASITVEITPAKHGA